VIFVDTNVFVYAVGKPHPLREEAQEFFISSKKSRKKLVTSAEVLQELIHIYLPVNRISTLDSALKLARGVSDEILPIEEQTVIHARQLLESFPWLSPRDLLHLAVCQIYGIKYIKTYDRALESASKKAL